MKQIYRVLVFVASVTLLFACGKEQRISSNMADEFLPVEEAFKYSAQVVDGNTIKAVWNIADGYHLYKNKLKFSVSPSAYQIVGVNYPKGDIIDDAVFGKQESYQHQLEVTIKLADHQSNEKLMLESHYQGCADKGLCYPPEKRTSTLDLSSI